MTDNNKPVMVFHVPFTILEGARSASGIRPRKMLQAFKDAGYEVLEISGNHEERQKLISVTRKRIKNGLKIDFVYSESATTPTGLGEKITRHTSVSRDIKFLNFCKKNSIPVGVFYRDVYWRFPSYKDAVKWPFSTILKTLYKRDLKLYRKGNLTVFLPSLEMAKWVPVIDPKNFAEMPPGSEVFENKTSEEQKQLTRDGKKNTTFFYVGGLNDYYPMHKTVEHISATPGAHMILCTRKEEWANKKAEYADLLSSNIEIVHQYGEGLNPLYERSDIGLLLFEVMTYREFAVPMKLFEYIGKGKPVVATKGSFAARFLEDNGLGWAIDYDDESILRFLQSILENPAEYEEKRRNVLLARNAHTWEARAREVAEKLGV